MSLLGTLGTTLRRMARGAVIAVAALALSAHVGTNDAFFDGLAGPYAVRVAVRMPGVIPGQAQIVVRVVQGEARRVLVQVAQWQVGRRGAPSPDVATPVAGAPNTYAAPLWLMTGGAYAVNVTVEGGQGAGAVTVPVNAVATARLGMQRALGWGLVALGATLIAGLLSLVGAALRESVVPPGETPDLSRRRAGRVGIAVTTGLVALGLVGGNTWWNAVDRNYARNLYRPLATRAELQPHRLRVVLVDSTFFGARTTPLMPDHGKLMHAFVVREPDHDVLAHVHPTRLDSATFDAELPDLPSGTYTVFADVVHESGFARTLVARATLTSPGTWPSPVAGGGSRGDDAWITGGASAGRAPLGAGVTLTRVDSAPIVAGVETTLRFEARDSTGRVIDVAPYLGMAGHAIVLRADDSVFVHLHPMGTISLAAQRRIARREAGDTTLHGAAQPDSDHAMDGEPTYHGVLTFPFAFPKAGRYRVWVQLRPNADVRTAVFDLDVR